MTALEAGPGSSPELLRQLRTTLAKLEIVLGAIRDAIVWTDTQGRIQWCNAAFDRLAARPHVELLGMNLAELIPERSGGAEGRGERHPVTRVLRGETLGDVDWPVELAGRRRILEAFGTPVAIRQDEGSAIFVLRDVTETRKAQEEIERLHASVARHAEELEEAVRELETFSYSVSHDLKVPLLTISGFVQMLREDFGDRLDATGLRYIDTITDSTEQMTRLIEDLLDFARVGRRPLERQRVDVESRFREIFDELMRVSPDRAVRLEMARLPGAWADPDMLGLVVSNLLTNAIKFTSPRERAVIAVSGSGSEGERVYCVRDNGMGFDMRYAHKLFGVFQRLHSVQEAPGTGVGLAIVHRIVTRHGGRVWAEGRVGEGATFWFSLPEEANVR